MKRVIIFGILFVIFTSVSTAEGQEVEINKKIAECAAIEGDLERLDF
jgi:hypothetical protein